LENNLHERVLFFDNKKQTRGGGRFPFPRIYGVKVLEEEILKNYPQLQASLPSTSNFPNGCSSHDSITVISSVTLAATTTTTTTTTTTGKNNNNNEISFSLPSYQALRIYL